MRVSINVEFTSEELIKHGEEFARRYTIGMIRDIGEHLAVNPSTVATLGQLLYETFARASSPSSSEPDCDGCGQDASAADVGPFAPDAPPVEESSPASEKTP